MARAAKYSKDQKRAFRNAARKRGAIDCLGNFVQYMWSIIEPGEKLVWNWHLDIMCEALEKQIAGDPEYRRLIFCVPPGTMKSLLVSVFAPAWRWLRDPYARSIYLADEDELAERDSIRTRRLIQSDRYKGLLEEAAEEYGYKEWVLSFDKNRTSIFENSAMGFRQSLGIGGSIIGKRGDHIHVDDPIDAKKIINGTVAQVTKRLQDTNNIIEVVLPSRVNDIETARWTMIMQRLHVNDPAARAIARGWKLIKFAMEFDPDAKDNHPQDPRTQHGELLFEAKFPKHAIEALKLTLGAMHFEAQYNQRPTITAGSLIPRSSLVKRYVFSPERMAAQMEAIGISLDSAFKKSEDTDFVVFQVWGRKGPDFYLLQQVRDRMNYPETREKMKELIAKWPQAVLKLVEEKANGPALIDDLKSTFYGLEPYDPQISKVARVNLVLPIFRGGNVFLPEAQYAPWLDDYIEELANFPHWTHDDQVDATSQILMYWTQVTAVDPMQELMRERERMRSLL